MIVVGHFKYYIISISHQTNKQYYFNTQKKIRAQRARRKGNENEEIYYIFWQDKE
jgi:hypothetical protein